MDELQNLREQNAILRKMLIDYQAAQNKLQRKYFNMRDDYVKMLQNYGKALEIERRRILPRLTREVCGWSKKVLREFEKEYAA